MERKSLSFTWLVIVSEKYIWMLVSILICRADLSQGLKITTDGDFNRHAGLQPYGQFGLNNRTWGHTWRDC